MRHYRVFNLEQCELPQTVLDKLPKIETHEHDPIEAADRIVAAMPKPPEIRNAGSRAFYSGMTDRVTMPPRNLFESAAEYSATLLHELTYSSGHPKRLAREGITDATEFDSTVYSEEELIAEMGAVSFAPKRDLKRRDRESGRVRYRMAQETPRRSKTSGPLCRPGPASADCILCRPHPVA